MTWRVVLFCLCFLLSSCTDPLKGLVNSAFPPVDADSQRQAAVATNVAALSHLPTPNLAIAVTLADAQTVLAATLSAQGVTKLSLDSDKGLLKIEATFDRAFSGKDSPKDPALAATLDRLQPHLAGSVTVYAGISGAVADDPTASDLVVNLLPVLSTAQVSKIGVAADTDSKVTAAALTKLLNVYKDNLSGVLTRAQFSKVKVPALASKPSDISGPLRTSLPGMAVRIDAKPLVVPFRLAGLAWLITTKQIEVMAQLVPVADKTSLQTIPIDPSYAGVSKRFSEVVDQVFQVEDAETRNWVVVSKDLVAGTMNAVLNQTAACVSAEGAIPTQHIASKIPMPNGAGVNCSINTTCSPKRDCSFHAKQDNRDCSACLLRTRRVCGPWHSGCIGGQCSIQGQDPTCQAAKLAQQTLYNVDENSRVADCNRLNAQDVAGCQAGVLAQTTLCVAKQQSLNALGKTGNLANLDGDVTVTAAGAHVCLQNFVLSPALDHVDISLGVQGGAKANVNLKYVPLDLGHAICFADWSMKRTFQANLQQQTLALGATVQLSASPDGYDATFQVAKIPVKVQMFPSPTALLMTNPDMLVKCPVVQFITPFAVALGPFVPELQGAITFDVPAHTLNTTLKPYSHVVLGQALKATLETTPSSLVVVGTVAAASAATVAERAQQN